MSTPREPLNAEERALARALAYAGYTADPGEPGLDLDARILAAARSAVDEAKPQAPGLASLPSSSMAHAPGPDASKIPRGRRRWTPGFGVAASLMLAMTIAWQLRPRQNPQIVDETASSPTQPQATPAPSPTGNSQAASAAATMPASHAPAPPAATPPKPALLSSPSAKHTPVQTAATVRKATVLPAFKNHMSHQIETYTPPPPPSPPAPAMPDLQSPEPVAGQGLAAGSAGAAATGHPLTAVTRSAPLQTTGQQRYVAGLATRSLAAADQLPSDLQSVLNQDRRLPADLWLRSIRKHRFQGQGALARASLQAFMQTYPDQVIPEDLHPLRP